MFNDLQYRKEIKFNISIYNNINKDKYGENRISDEYLFLSDLETSTGIMCYNTYLGEIEVKRRKNDINFVMSFSIFDNMNRNVLKIGILIILYKF